MNSLMSQSESQMDKAEFLAAIKLVSGEELLSMVTSVHDENGDYLIVENPIEIEEVEVFYHMSLRKLNTDFITDAKGKISTVDEARIKLNKIFNKDS